MAYDFTTLGAIMKKIWRFITAPFKWIWNECKDIKTLIWKYFQWVCQGIMS